jgi:DNA-binding transcriptional ArsR family regulator
MNITEQFDVEAMRFAAANASILLKALANPDRLLLLCQLSQGEHCVGDLEALLGVLRTEGLVSTRRQGKNIFYSVADPAALEVLTLLYRLYCSQAET